MTAGDRRSGTKVRACLGTPDRLRTAADPFVDCIFDDNGDVTVATTRLADADWLALRAATEE